MKRILPFTFVIVMIFYTSCKTDKITVAGSIWYVGTTKHIANSTSRSATDHSLSAEDGINQYSVYFSDFPTATGNFHVVSYNKRTSLASNEICVATATSVYDNYLSTGNDNISVQVQVTKGKLYLDLPAVWAQHYNTSGPQPDSLQVSGTLVEI